MIIPFFGVEQANRDARRRARFLAHRNKRSQIRFGAALFACFLLLLTVLILVYERKIKLYTTNAQLLVDDTKSNVQQLLPSTPQNELAHNSKSALLQALHNTASDAATATAATQLQAQDQVQNQAQNQVQPPQRDTPQPVGMANHSSSAASDAYAIPDASSQAAVRYAAANSKLEMAKQSTIKQAAYRSVLRPAAALDATLALDDGFDDASKTKNEHVKQPMRSLPDTRLEQSSEKLKTEYRAPEVQISGHKYKSSMSDTETQPQPRNHASTMRQHNAEKNESGAHQRVDSIEEEEGGNAIVVIVGNKA